MNIECIVDPAKAGRDLKWLTIFYIRKCAKENFIKDRIDRVFIIYAPFWQTCDFSFVSDWKLISHGICFLNCYEICKTSFPNCPPSSIREKASFTCESGNVLSITGVILCL